MVLRDNLEISAAAISTNIKKLINQTYKLLPNREEGIDWQTPLTTIIEELSGMSRLLVRYQSDLFAILCKLEGLYQLTAEKDFFLYRRTVFECLGLMSNLKGEIEICQD